MGYFNCKVSLYCHGMQGITILSWDARYNYTVMGYFNCKVSLYCHGMQGITILSWDARYNYTVMGYFNRKEIMFLGCDRLPFLWNQLSPDLPAFFVAVGV